SPSRTVPTRPKLGNSEKIGKKPSGDRPKKREKEILVPNRFYPSQIREFRKKKIAKKFKKLKNIILALFQAKNGS
ncbi:hypothetical protein L0F76_13870, partial [Staphylococcus aureus]|nr:hypothetical protein [Staphylococcus aureus]